MSRRNRRRNQPQDAGQQQESGPQAARRWMNEMPLPSSVTFIPNSCVCPGDPPPPPPADGENASTPPPRESRANATKRALRSRLLFPLEVLDQINALAADYALQLKLSTSLERWLAIEAARSSVQIDECFDQLRIDKVRVIERVSTSFDDDCAAPATVPRQSYTSFHPATRGPCPGPSMAQ